MLADFKTRNQTVHWLNPKPEIQSVLSSVAGEAFSMIASIDELFPAQEDNEQVPSSYQNQELHV